jgi:acyl-CoA thioesterase-1
MEYVRKNVREIMLTTKWKVGLILGAWLAALALFTSPSHAAGTPQRILVVGDSLSAEYGIPRGAGWVKLLEQQLASDKATAALPVTVINAAISGETTSGGLSRLPALLAQHKPTIVIIELGGNDALRGMAMAQTEKNFAQMVSLSKAAGAKVLLLGMQVPPNFGAVYGKEFAGVYARVAKQHNALLVPFFLKNVADGPNARELFQADGIHPTAAAHPAMLANVWPELKKLLKH